MRPLGITTMMKKAHFSFAALALAASLGVAHAQTAQNRQEQEVHDPAGQAAPHAQAPAPRPHAGGHGMMGGDMSHMMGMMQQMMRGMRPMGGGGMSPGGQPFRHIEGQLAFLKAELRVADAQLPQWNAFADAIRANAKRLRETMAAAAGGMGHGVPAAPDQLERHAARLAAMLEAVRAVQAAVTPLYAALSPEQKKTADELMAEHFVAMRMRGA
jgi:LTXXQ motif family protein